MKMQLHCQLHLEGKRLVRGCAEVAELIFEDVFHIMKNTFSLISTYISWSSTGEDISKSLMCFFKLLALQIHLLR